VLVGFRSHSRNLYQRDVLTGIRTGQYTLLGQHCSQDNTVGS